MNEKEFNAVIKLPANIRYEYFIKKVVSWEEVWGLFDDGWAMTEDDDGKLMMTFWPKKEFAEFCVFEEWSDYKPQSITLDEFITDWLPGLKKDGYKPSIFWNRDDSAVLDIDILLEDLKEELEKY
ncbi:DUF2750 domain-containing protein [Paenibacillus popilliae]|uniref:DUF2750 domain-containing protein n=1 Tax=Paenibacillus popilliae ATCC 14706 TaxID=1212764 RepID=M9LL85_PAEPP|nr:DUF2750 domain-containing protein [Paenibacillus popilliae]GAC44105.1 hypothetical protein PPOP_3508 [Paenibacillus popilliae ATCC 14706]